MNIVPLNEKFLSSYCHCLEEWSDEMKEAGGHKADWYAVRKDQGLRVLLAVEDGRAAGMIQYVPIQHGFASGRDLYFIHCIWVHGYKNKGVGNMQKRGIGSALLAAAEEDARRMGAKGMAAWGVSLPFFMRASWFRKHGYRRADKNGMMVLLWKPLSEDSEPPHWIWEKKKPAGKPGKVAVTAFLNGWCPAMAMVFERAKRAAAELGEKVEFQPILTRDREVFLEWGIADGLYIDGKAVRTGPPPSYEKIKKKIARRVKKLG